MGFYWSLLGFIVCYLVLPDVIEVLPSFTEFHWILPSFTGFYLIFLFFTSFSWILLEIMGF